MLYVKVLFVFINFIFLCYVTICFAADVLSNRKLLGMLLKRKGIRSEVVVDGLEAIAIVKSKPHDFDLIFMDNTMPNLVRMMYIYILHDFIVYN